MKTKWFYVLVIGLITLGINDFACRQNFRIHQNGDDWYLRAWIVAGAGALLFTFIVLWVDRFEQEPWKLIVLALLWGAFAATFLNFFFGEFIRLRLFKFYLDVGFERDVAISTVLDVLRRQTPFREELTKGLFILILFLLLPRKINGLLDGIIYGAMVGIGFAMVEQVKYLQSAAYNPDHPSYQGFLEEFRRRILLTGLWSHPMLTAFTGAGFGISKKPKNGLFRWLLPTIGFAIAVMVHYAWNIFGELIEDEYSFEVRALIIVAPTALILVFLVWLGLVREGRIRTHMVCPDECFVSKDEMSSPLSRIRSQGKSLKMGGFSLWRKVVCLQYLLMKSAYLDHTHLNGGPSNENMRERISNRISQLSDEISSTQF